MGASWSASWRWPGHGAPRPSTQPCPSTVASTEPTSSGTQGTRRDPHGSPLVDVMPALGCQPRSNGLRRAVTPGPSQRQDGPPSLLTRPSGCWASRGCGLPGRVPRSGTNPGSPELGRVGGQVPVPVHSCESVRVRGVHACAHKLHTFPTGRLSSTRKSPAQSGAPGRVRTCDPPLRRCRHRGRTRSSLSSQPPRPGLSPRHGPIGPGQTAHRSAHIIGT